MKNEGNSEGIFYTPVLLVKNIVAGMNFSKDNIFNVISNKQRQEIIRFCYTEKRTITEIQKHIGLSYSPTWKHVNMLMDKGLVTGTPGIDKKKGAVIYVSSIKDKLNEEFTEVNKKYGHLVSKRK